MDSAKTETLMKIPDFVAAESWCGGGRRARDMSVGSGDVDGLGVGDPPFQGEDAEGVMLAEVDGSVPCLSIPSCLVDDS